jgi:hypothetical protein
LSYFKQAIPSVDSTTEQPTKQQNNFNSTIKSKQKAPLTTRGFEPYQVKKEKQKGGTEKISIAHAAGSIPGHTQIKQSFLAPDPMYDEDIVHNWIPHMSLSVADDKTGRPLTAAQIQAKSNFDNWIPHYFMNPMQDLDYIAIEALTRFTFVGALMNALTKFIIGTGFRPELELVNPSTNKDKDKKEIESNQDIIDALVQIDSQLNKNDAEHIDVPFTDKIAALIDVTNTFNRSALIFGYDTPIEIDGKPYKQIPSSIKFAHARDLGIIDVDPGTWRLKAVQWRNAFYMVPARDMIYLWNPLISAKTRGSWLYGDSMIMPMLDASRVIRKNIGVNFPAMAEATWSGMFLMAVKPQGTTAAQKQDEYNQIAKKMVRGAPNILMENPDDVKFQDVDFHPKVTEFKDLTEALIRYCVASTGLPHSMFYDESQSNRATMLGKIELATSTVINPLRAWIGRSISDQWYQRWFRLICKEKNKMDLYKKFRIKMTFSDLHIAQWFDKIEAVNSLDSRRQLTDEAYGDLIGIENYKNKVEAGSQVQPGGRGSSFKFGDGKNGFEIKNTKSE